MAKRKRRKTGGRGEHRGRVTLKRADATTRGNTSTRAPDTLEQLVRDAVWVLGHEDAAGTDRWASAIQSVLRPTGLPPTAVTTPAAVLSGLAHQPVPAAILVAAALAKFGPAEARAQATTRAAGLRERLEGDEPIVNGRLGAVTPGRTALLSDAYGDGYGVYLDFSRDGEVA